MNETRDTELLAALVAGARVVAVQREEPDREAITAMMERNNGQVPAGEWPRTRSFFVRVDVEQDYAGRAPKPLTSEQARLLGAAVIAAGETCDRAERRWRETR